MPRSIIGRSARQSGDSPVSSTARRAALYRDPAFKNWMGKVGQVLSRHTLRTSPSRIAQPAHWRAQYDEGKTPRQALEHLVPLALAEEEAELRRRLAALETTRGELGDLL